MITGIAGAALIAYSVYLTAKQPFHLGLIVPGLSALALIGWGLLPQGHPLRIACLMIWGLFVLFFIASCVCIVLSLRQAKKVKNAPYWILVPGYAAGKHGMTDILIHRLRLAVRTAERFPQARILLTGGSPKGGESEAARMKAFLLAHGIAEERILTEDKSSSSYENMLFGKKIWEENGRGRVLIVTSSTHVLRAGKTARHVGLPADCLAAPVPAIVLPAEIIREGILLVKTALLGYASLAWVNGRL